MKAILIDWSSRWDTMNLGVLRHDAPKKFYKVIPKAYDGKYPYCFAVYDVSMLTGVGAGDGETLVSIKDEKGAVCDSIIFIEDDKDFIEYMTKDYIKEIESDNVFGNGKVEEIDTVAKVDKLDKLNKNIKSKIKATVKDMLASGELIPSRPKMFDNENLFTDTEEEMICLGSYIYRGVPGIQEYIVKKVGLDVYSVKMFTVKDYEYPLIAICLPSDFYEESIKLSMQRRINDFLENVECYSPVLDRTNHHNGIDMCWKDVQLKFKNFDCIVEIYQYNPNEPEKRELESKAFKIMVSEGIMIDSKNENELTINFPAGVTTIIGNRLLKMICDHLNDKFVISQDTEYYRYQIINYTKMLFNKIVMHDYPEGRNKFMYRRIY